MPLWKRGADIAFGLAAMPVILAGMIVIALLHKLVSRGPIFFSQERIGHQGKRFLLYKFRTMGAGSAIDSHKSHLGALMVGEVPLEKMDCRGDSRIIPGGWFIRASGLDELPQFFNVLRGEMSLVGPRPCLPYEYDNYLPWQRQRFDVAPGLTGLWQVSGKNRTTFEQMVRLDVEYAQTRSPGLDFRIILRTLPALVQQIGDTRRAKLKVRLSAGSAVVQLSDNPSNGMPFEKII
jgi:lipopolysaccharide/colanic/teichoic acid biosynthesis glycosyltransferase